MSDRTLLWVLLLYIKKSLGNEVNVRTVAVVVTPTQQWQNSSILYKMSLQSDKLAKREWSLRSLQTILVITFKHGKRLVYYVWSL